MREFNSIEELQPLVGQEVAVSDWITIDQERIDRFADATSDHQWIHVDPERAKTGPFGTTVAHGFLTLSLLPYLTYQAIAFNNTKLAINYGLDRVRFPAPVPVGSRLRGRFKLQKIEILKPLRGMPGAQLVWEVTIEREGSSKPVCVAESVSRRYG
ncbi:MAG TPA: MaoC family dehydratase [Steroidobacteraceae bacterium]|jgi:acyl dehydratase|nr:MaoC family dehydratase [Steroidobacteraceae bacterium]